MIREIFSTIHTPVALKKHIPPLPGKSVPSIDRWKVDGVAVHSIEGRVSWPSERKGIPGSTDSFETYENGGGREGEGKSSKGHSGTTPARKKRPFRLFQDRRVRHLISLSLTGRYSSVLRFLTLFYLRTRGRTSLSNARLLARDWCTYIYGIS